MNKEVKAMNDNESKKHKRGVYMFVSPNLRPR